MSLAENYSKIRQEIAVAASSVGRDPAEINLLAVSKGQPIDLIKEAYALGIRDFGESYWQEADVKIAALKDLSINWHFIGKLQSNKLKDIARNFAWVHSVTRERELISLNQYRQPGSPPIKICLETHLPNSLVKSGVSSLLLPKLLDTAISLYQIELRGLMMMLDPNTPQSEQEKSFAALKQELISLNNKYKWHLDTLSMGMSQDFKNAIKAGSTWVRLGRRLFF